MVGDVKRQSAKWQHPEQTKYVAAKLSTDIFLFDTLYVIYRYDDWLSFLSNPINQLVRGYGYGERPFPLLPWIEQKACIGK